MFTKGYNNTCSRKCGAILFRKELKQNAEKFRKFTDKVSENQARIWEDREKSGAKDIISNRAGSTHKENNKLLTDTERKDRFGWLNNLSNEDKEHWKQQVMFNTGCHKFWSEATEEQRKDQQIKRCNTMIANGNMISPDRKSDKERYYSTVRNITRRTYNKNKDILNPDGLQICRGHLGYHVDHMVSIQQGFINNIDPEIIGSIHNLCVLSGKENNKKSSKNSQTVEELLEKYHGK